jgi:hypothetical protein
VFGSDHCLEKQHKKGANVLVLSKIPSEWLDGVDILLKNDHCRQILAVLVPSGIFLGFLQSNELSSVLEFLIPLNLYSKCPFEGIRVWTSVARAY